MCWRLRWICLLVIMFPILAGAQNFSQPEPKRFGKRFWISVGVLGAATFADAYSSRGHVERNPLLQNSSGRFSVGKAFAVKSGMAAGLITLELWMMNRNPGTESERLSSFTNFVSAGIFAGTAVYNSRPRQSTPTTVPSYLGTQ